MWLAEETRSVNAEAVLLEGHPASKATEWAAEAGVDVMVAATHRGLVERAARQLRQATWRTTRPARCSSCPPSRRS